MTVKYALDDNIILDNCTFQVPKGYQKKCNGKTELTHEDKNKIQKLVDFLESKQIKPIRFVNEIPEVRDESLTQRYIKTTNELLETFGLSTKTKDMTLYAEFTFQLEEFLDEVNENFELVLKSDEFEDVKSFFEKNEKELKRETNIPENDDCKILKAYFEYEADKKHFVSADEHFWGYKKEIQEYYDIIITERWFCHKLAEEKD